MAEPRDDYGSGTPAWLADDTKIEVDVTRLDDYGRHVRGELENFVANMKQAVEALAKHNVPFGGGGLPEGASFRAINDRNKGASTQMMGEVVKGLAAFSSAAFAIAQEYGSGDALSKATTDGVYSAFVGDGKQKMLSELQGGSGADDKGGAATGPEETDPDIDASTDPVSGDGKTEDNEDDGRVEIGEGAGSYTVWEDSEQVKSVPTDVASANDGKPVILAPGAPGGSSSSSGTVA